MFGVSDKLKDYAEIMLLDKDFLEVLYDNDLTEQDVLEFLLDNGLIDYGLYRDTTQEES